MAKLHDWEINGIGGAKAYADDDEITVILEGKVIAEVRFTPQGVLAVDAKNCTVYIKPDAKTINVSFNRSER